MTSSLDTTDLSTSPTPRGTRAYWIVTGLFCVAFIGSALLTFVDPAAQREELRTLEFPDYWAIPLASLKLAGVATILVGRWRTLTLFAFAGFLFDMVLALSAHIDQSDPKAFLAVAGLLLWAGAFWVDRRRFGPARAA